MRDIGVEKKVENANIFSKKKSARQWLNVSISDASKLFIASLSQVAKNIPGPPFTKQTYVSPQDLVKSRSHEIRI